MEADRSHSHINWHHHHIFKSCTSTSNVMHKIKGFLNLLDSLDANLMWRSDRSESYEGQSLESKAFGASVYLWPDHVDFSSVWDAIIIFHSVILSPTKGDLGFYLFHIGAKPTMMCYNESLLTLSTDCVKCARDSANAKSIKVTDAGETFESFLMECRSFSLLFESQDVGSATVLLLNHHHRLYFMRDKISNLPCWSQVTLRGF